jgi:hypothetical protein
MPDTWMRISGITYLQLSNEDSGYDKSDMYYELSMIKPTNEVTN